jgi:hypothetical protein
MPESAVGQLPPERLVSPPSPTMEGRLLGLWRNTVPTPDDHDTSPVMLSPRRPWS